MKKGKSLMFMVFLGILEIRRYFRQNYQLKFDSLISGKEEHSLTN